MVLPKSKIGLLLLCLVCFKLLVAEGRHYRFALCPKFKDENFFGAAHDGCVERATQLNKEFNETGEGDTVECVYVGHSVHSEEGALQAAAILQGFDEQGPFDGVSIAVTDSNDLQPVYDAIKAQNIPLITFDSDDPDSGRAAYVGTDNVFMGSQLAKVLQKLAPGGGNYAILSTESPNLDQRTMGIQGVLRNDPVWQPYDIGSPNGTEGYVSYGNDNEQGIIVMKKVLEENPNIDAFIATTAVAMGYPKWGEFVNEHPGTLFITADDWDFQLKYLKLNKVHGLVGQIPYEMGVLSMDTLLDLARGKEVLEFIGTNVLEHLVVPLVLPPLTVEDNRLPVWAVALGICLMVIVVTTATVFSSWTFWNRNNRIVQLAQPEFLITIAVGCVIFAASLIPLSLEPIDTEGNPAICMATPWLLCIGFTIIFAALWGKTYRAYHVVKSSWRFRRTTLTVRDVAKPLVALLLANVLVLTLWTVLAPLRYTRKDSSGTDEWNRVLATYGQCESDKNAVPYVSVLAVLNVGVLLIANYFVYKARILNDEFQESKYIAIAMSSMLQIVAVGAPVLMLIRDNALAWFLTFALVVFFVAFGILCIMFAPKMHATKAPPAEAAPSKSTHISSASNGSPVRGSALSSRSVQGGIVSTGASDNDSNRISTIFPNQNTKRDETASNELPSGNTSDDAIISSPGPSTINADQNESPSSLPTNSDSHQKNEENIMEEP